MLHPERIIITIDAEGVGKTLLELATELVGAAEAAHMVTHGASGLIGDGPKSRGAGGCGGDELTLRRPPQHGYAHLELQATDICYEDAWLIAIHKRAGWYSSITPWDLAGNVPAALERYLLARDGAVPPLHLAHRLDRDTSGVLLLSKDGRVNAPLLEAFRQGQVSKRYLGMCGGIPPESGDIQSGHG
ncbi:RluA family pseudouridine synthase, partial [Candidatus Gracilibacteria bacterium]|nr:RluA family pseudouridine synthase [Candidatus Gracilibacteria bacterium]